MDTVVSDFQQPDKGAGNGMSTPVLFATFCQSGALLETLKTELGLLSKVHALTTGNLKTKLCLRIYVL